MSDKQETAVKQEWKELSFGFDEKKLYFYYDPLNEAVYVHDDSCYVMLMGTAMDTIDYHMNIKTIAEKLLGLYGISEESMLDYVDCLCGRHIIVYGDKDNVYLISDATGMRSVFYCTEHLLISMKNVCRFLTIT